MAGAGKGIFIEDLQEGQQVRDIFLVARKTLAETKAGKPYLALSLMDRSGEIEARVWDNAAAYDSHARVGNYVVVQGTAKLYRDQLQMGVVFLEKVNSGSVNPADFMPASKRDAAEMRAELETVIASVSDPGLQQLLVKVFSGETLEQFLLAPAAKKMHHAYLGGLLEHTLSVTGLADKLAEHYPELDRDMLITGGLLHDLAKIREFSFAAPPFDYTDQGRLMGHLVIGVEMVRQAAAEISDVSPQRLDQVCHLILSHHGRHEFGAPVLPMTQEALLLHHVDDIDAKMNYTDQLREKITEQGHQWTDYQRPLERFLYLQPLSGSEQQPSASEKRPAVVRKKKVQALQAEVKDRQQTLF
jgi:3'-5' exoribonuclease